MKYELKAFQANALAEMLGEVDEAQHSFNRTGKTQVISLTAPTGSGKTIIATSFIESIFMGDENRIERPDSIFVWLSDSPELNEQSKAKIERTANRLRFGQCVTIDADSFNRESLEEGYIYFLNTQKLSKSSRLVTGGDGRDYTIWETLQNTIEEKADKLIVIIDEAHRGMKDRGAKEATTTMQKFIKGSEQDGLSPFPVVVGMSATSARFNTLVGNANATIRRITISPSDVIKSGLLKDEVVVLYPKDTTTRVDMAVLQAATDDWIKKSNHWEIFFDKQKSKRVNPIFLIQVENGTAGRISNTDTDEVIATIESRIGYAFGDDEIVHAFGEKTTLTINNRTVRYEEPSRIEENKAVKVVLFKDALSTGWDCPRAETMVSFRRATDATYIAQLLGRMLRTPLHQRVNTDEYLNSVYLFLPYFNQDTVEKIVKELKSDDDGLPTNVGTSGIGETSTLTARPRRPQNQAKKPDEKKPITQSQSDNTGNKTSYNQETGTTASNDSSYVRGSNQSIIPLSGRSTTYNLDNSESQTQHGEGTGTPNYQPAVTHEIIPSSETDEETVPDDGVDRISIIEYINNRGIPSYNVRKESISDYLKSVFDLAGLLSQTGLYAKATEDIKQDAAGMIRDYIADLKSKGSYDAAITKLLEFTLSSQAFDVFGGSVNTNIQQDYLSSTDSDIDRQFLLSEKKLRNEGIGVKYGKLYGDPESPNKYKMDVILFVSDSNQMNNLTKYAENKYHELVDTYRPRIKNLNDKYRTRFRTIVNDSDAVSEHDFWLPDTIDGYPSSESGKLYDKHLYVDEKTLKVRIKLNGWEDGLLQEESRRDDFVCWLRNPERRSWSLCIPYEKGGYKESMFPDFVVVRRDGPHDYFIDILEPHDPSRNDNVGKAKGLAEYAEHYDFGRIQLIRKRKSPTGDDGFIRLDMSKSRIRTRVKSVSTDEELDHIFDEQGFFE